VEGCRSEGKNLQLKEAQRLTKKNKNLNENLTKVSHWYYFRDGTEGRTNRQANEQEGRHGLRLNFIQLFLF